MTSSLKNSVLGLFILFTHSMAFGLDPIEPYDKGWSNYEAYFAANDEAVGTAATIGYGGSSSLWNPSLTFDFAKSDESSLQALTLANISNTQINAFQFNLVPIVSFYTVDSENSTDGALVLEGSYTAGNFTPFLTLEYLRSLSDSELDPLYAGALGLSVQTEIGEVLGSIAVLGPNSDKLYQLGFNKTLANSLELITEVNFQDQPGWGGLMGVIWTP